MLDTPDCSTQLSEERAQEIFNFVNGKEDTEFGNVRNSLSLESLTRAAYHRLNLTVPGNLKQIVEKASRRLGKKQERKGLDIGLGRARHLVNHLLGMKDEAHFREDDNIVKQRELFRKAIAKVSSEKEFLTGDTHHHLILEIDKWIEQRYPLAENELEN